jgi:hypothetical protein
VHWTTTTIALRLPPLLSHVSLPPGLIVRFFVPSPLKLVDPLVPSVSRLRHAFTPKLVLDWIVAPAATKVQFAVESMVTETEVPESSLGAGEGSPTTEAAVVLVTAVHSEAVGLHVWPELFVVDHAPQLEPPRFENIR